MDFSDGSAARPTHLQYGIDRIYVHPDAAESLYTRRLVETLTTDDSRVVVDQVAEKGHIPREHLTTRTIYLHRAPQPTFGPCPGSRGRRCCNYRTVDIYEGCPIGCSYCIMRSYLTFAPIAINVAVRQEIDAIRAEALAHPRRALRVGTGEVGDSLLFDALTGISADIVSGLSDLDNVHFELKTKTTRIEHLLDRGNKGNAIVAFSVNPAAYAAEQGWADSIDARLAAAQRAATAGYRLAFHFDPIFALDGWQKAYDDLIASMAALSTARVAWISLGTIRYTADLRERMPDRPYLFDEFVPGPDGKFRYLQHRRTALYRHLLDRLRSVFDAPIYLCMESTAVWERVYGALPGRIPKLRDIFDSAEEEQT